MPAYEFDYIKKEVKEITQQIGKLSPDNAFIVWFLRAFFTDDQDQAINALTGGAKDKGIDAIHIDREARTVFVVQGKYRQGDTPPSENRSDLMAFADYAHILPGPVQEFKTILNNADASIQSYLEQARHAVVQNGYRVGLLYVTTGKVSKAHAKELEEKVARQDIASLQIFDRASLLRLLHDYVEGAAPPVPKLRLPVLDNTEFMRYDEITKATSWIFAMPGNEVGNLFKIAGRRLFARNIRGFLGQTKINKGMRLTLKNNPEYFWYFNNGVTIICDTVSTETVSGQKYLIVTTPQVINGQQTTRSLAEDGAGTSKAAVLVKIIAVNRETAEGREQYGQLVSQIVSATNFQNEIHLSDLRANDEEQVRLERELRKWGVLYVRKHQSKIEVRRVHGSKYKVVIKKEDLARAVAGCLLDPSTLRLGKENLFDEDNYSKIFNGRPILEYFCYYWLNRAVRWRIVGSEQGYAKWLVLNFIWSQIGEKLKRPAFASWFCTGMKNYYAHEDALYPLLSGVDVVFTVAMDFYRKNRKSKSGNLDASSFFKYAKLHTQFREHWLTRANSKRRKRFESRLQKFVEGVQAEL
jgi:hypothetical protein